MNKADYIMLGTVGFLSFFLILKWKEKRKDRFEEEISNLENAVESTASKFSK